MFVFPAEKQYQPRRILITHHPDFVVRFQDFSSQLLLSSPEAPLSSAFPSELPALTIELASLLADPSLHFTPSHSIRRSSPIPSHPSSRTPSVSSINPEESPRIHSVHLASESLECVIVLRTGAVVLYRLDMPNEATSFPRKELPDNELVSLEHTDVRAGLRYHPFLGVKPTHGQVSACAISDVGVSFSCSVPTHAKQKTYRVSCGGIRLWCTAGDRLARPTGRHA